MDFWSTHIKIKIIQITKKGVKTDLLKHPKQTHEILLIHESLLHEHLLVRRVAQAPNQLRVVPLPVLLILVHLRVHCDLGVDVERFEEGVDILVAALDAVRDDVLVDELFD